jgi:acyl-lipid omega-6 desaturase (Delta-12 desaturase)
MSVDPRPLESQALPSRRDLIRACSRFATSSTPHGIALFALDAALYVAAIAGVLFMPALWQKIACSVIAGMAQAKLMVVAHDAAHLSLVNGRRLNRLIGIVAMTLCHYNFRLWNFEHHRLHHPDPNDAHPDAFTPLCKKEFDALPFWRQWLHRVYRAPNLIGFGVYYIVERYWWTKVGPPHYIPADQRASAWRHAALLLTWVAALATLLVAAPAFAVNLTAVEALALGLFLPFFAFQCQNSFALFTQHTDPAIPWFAETADRNGAGRAELLSVDLRTPRLMGWFYHDIFAHPVHHLLPRIPCYRVREAQDHLARLMGPHAIVRHLSPRWLLDTTSRCKLYDWQARRWTDFEGHPTSEPVTPAPADASPAAAHA